MLFRISHTTRFEYDRPVYDSQNELRMRPHDGRDQRCLEFELVIDQPGAVLAYDDYFGNHAHSVSVSAPHETLMFVIHALIERIPPAPGAYPEVPFSRFLLDDAINKRTWCEFLSASRMVPFSERLQRFFWMVHPSENEDVSTYADRIVAYVRDQFEYEKSTTHVHSSLDDILKSGGGVCQDFAHLTIGLFRLAGVPARYVSGYLAPEEPKTPTGARALGEQATHAWLEAWLPGEGWTGFDPTHRCRTDQRHIRVAIGRDYADVPPLRGMYRSRGVSQVMSVNLNVRPVEPRAPSAPANGSQSQQ